VAEVWQGREGVKQESIPVDLGPEYEVETHPTWNSATHRIIMVHKLLLVRDKGITTDKCTSGIGKWNGAGIVRHVLYISMGGCV